MLDADRRYGPHEGLDFLAEIGDPVLACLHGRVSDVSSSDSGYGNQIVIEHNDGFVTWYGHLDSTVCHPGDDVVRGEIIGYAGNTGDSEGPHLHLTVQHRGHGMSGYWLPDVVDPQNYL